MRASLSFPTPGCQVRGGVCPCLPVGGAPPQAPPCVCTTASPGSVLVPPFETRPSLAPQRRVDHFLCSRFSFSAVGSSSAFSVRPALCSPDLPEVILQLFLTWSCGALLAAVWLRALQCSRRSLEITMHRGRCPGGHCVPGTTPDNDAPT